MKRTTTILLLLVVAGVLAGCGRTRPPRAVSLTSVAPFAFDGGVAPTSIEAVLLEEVIPPNTDPVGSLLGRRVGARARFSEKDWPRELLFEGWRGARHNAERTMDRALRIRFGEFEYLFGGPPDGKLVWVCAGLDRQIWVAPPDAFATWWAALPWPAKG